MHDFVPPAPERSFELPVVLLLGTSMSAGKTTSAKARRSSWTWRPGAWSRLGR
jgi:hypothetical protein